MIDLLISYRIFQLLNASETWVVDSGLDYGISRLIGNAVRNELQFRQSKREYEVYVRGYLRKHRHAIVLMGVVPTSLLKGAEVLILFSWMILDIFPYFFSAEWRELYFSNFLFELSYYFQETEAEHDNDASSEDHPDKFDVNPFHTHFLFVKSTNRDMTAIRRSQIMMELANQASARKSPTFVYGMHVNGLTRY